MDNFKKLIKEAYLGNPLNEDRKAIEYIKSISDPEERESERKRMFGDDELDEATDFNDPALIAARAAQMKRDEMDKEEAEYKAKQAALNKKYGSSFMDKLDAELDLKAELADLEDEREDVLRNMEQEAEPEGGPIADDYGSILNDMDARMTAIKSELDDLRMYESVNENEDSYVRVSQPRFIKDKNNPNFLFIRMDYDTGPGVSIALGKETMAGQIRRLSSQEAMRRAEEIARNLGQMFDIEDIDIVDMENGTVEIFAVSDDFENIDPKSKFSWNGYKYGLKSLNEGLLNENMGEWPKELTSRYSDEYRFELEKVSPTYQDKPGRAKYRVIDIESGELKGTPVFEKPESLMAYADDLIKPQGGTQSSHFGTNEGTCGYGEDGKIGDKPAGPVDEEKDTDVGGGAEQDNRDYNFSDADDGAYAEEHSGVVGENKEFDFKKMVKEALTPDYLKK